MSWLVYALVAMITQGTILFIVKSLSFNINPLVILLYQYVGSLIASIVYLLYKKVSFKVKRRHIGRVLLSGFLVSTGLAFYYLSLGLASASRVVPIHNIGITLIPAVYGFIYLKEALNKRVIIGIACSLVSILLLAI